MLEEVIVYGAGVVSGVLVTALALHLNRKTVAVTTAEYIKKHAQDAYANARGGVSKP